MVRKSTVRSKHSKRSLPVATQQKIFVFRFGLARLWRALISSIIYERANLMGLCVSHHILTEGVLLFPWVPAVCGARLCEMKKENENETQHFYAFYIYNTYIMHV